VDGQSVAPTYDLGNIAARGKRNRESHDACRDCLNHRRSLTAVALEAQKPLFHWALSTTAMVARVTWRSKRMRHNFVESAPFIGIGGLTVAAFLYGYSAIALPSWLNSVVLPLLWLVLFVLACAWFAKHPRRVMLLPLLAIAAWFAAMLG
jgi:hypothetical protein